MVSVRVPGFSPSTNGLPFINWYPHEPDLTIALPFGRVLPIGDAANGLCGGMAFAVADYFEAKRSVPADPAAPAAGTLLYQFIVKRLFDSFNLPAGIGRYLELMQPALPDVSFAPGVPSRASIMLEHEWPSIQRLLDAGHPVPLGLVKVKSAAPEDLGKNHQVLAYGYDLDDAGSALTMWLYDPNYGSSNQPRMQLNIASPRTPVSLSYVPSDETVYCFFRTHYSPAAPPVLAD